MASNSLKMVAQNVQSIDWKDWRIKLIGLSMLFVTVVTMLIFFIFPQSRDVTTFFGATFASWIAGIALSIFVTLIIAFVSLARPENEVFEARARNFLRGDSGPHIDYIVPELQKLLQPYCSLLTREIDVISYDKKTKKFRTNQTTTSQLRSYLNDKPLSFGSVVAYENATQPPKGGEKNALDYLEVDGQRIGETETFVEVIKRPFNMTVKPHQDCIVKHRMSVWILATEESNRHKPNRYNQELSIRITNHLPTHKLLISAETLAGSRQRSNEFELSGGETIEIFRLAGLKPNVFVYDFRLRVA